MWRYFIHSLKIICQPIDLGGQQVNSFVQFETLGYLFYSETLRLMKRLMKMTTFIWMSEWRWPVGQAGLMKTSPGRLDRRLRDVIGFCLPIDIFLFCAVPRAWLWSFRCCAMAFSFDFYFHPIFLPLTWYLFISFRRRRARSVRPATVQLFPFLSGLY